MTLSLKNIVLFTDDDQEGNGDPEHIVLFTDDDQEGDGDS